MGGLLDPDAYFDLVLAHADPPPDPAEFALEREPLPVAAWRSWWAAAARLDDLSAAASKTGFVLTPGEADAHGITRSMWRTRLQRGRWQTAGRGHASPIDVHRDLPDVGAEFVVQRRRHALRAAGASRSRPHDTVAGRSAAIVHGLPTVRVPDAVELLLAGREGAGLLSSGHLYAAACPAADVTRWFGVRVTTPARTLVDLARHDRFDAIMAADAALRERLTTGHEIERVLGSARRWPGVKQARRVLALADRRSESPLESCTRLRLLESGFPVPELQIRIGPYRVDFYWPRYRFVLEADGRTKYTSEERWREKKREQFLRRSGLVSRVERVTWSDVFGAGWSETVEILDGVFRAGG